MFASCDIDGTPHQGFRAVAIVNEWPRIDADQRVRFEGYLVEMLEARFSAARMASQYLDVYASIAADAKNGSGAAAFAADV